MEEKENAAHGDVSVEESIAVLESLLDRIKTYEHMFPLYPKDYLAKLSDVDRKALEKAISVLKSLD